MRKKEEDDEEKEKSLDKNLTTPTLRGRIIIKPKTKSIPIKTGPVREAS